MGVFQRYGRPALWLLLLLIGQLAASAPLCAAGAFLSVPELREATKALGLANINTNSELMAILRRTQVLSDPAIAKAFGGRQPTAFEVLEQISWDDKLAAQVRKSIAEASARRLRPRVIDCDAVASQVDLFRLSETLQDAEARTNAFNYVQGVIQRGLPMLGEREPASERQLFAQQAFFENAAQLSDAERATLRREVVHATLPDPTARFSALLALYDESTWRATVAKIASDGVGTPKINDELVPLLDAMPAPLRTLVVKDIKSLYPDAPKLSAGSPFMVLGPKRALDVMLRYLTDPAERYAQLRKGASAKEAFDAVLRETGIGSDYGAEEVLNGARELRKTLLAYEQASHQQADLRLVGSVPNGKARAGSDWDVKSVHQGLEKKFEAMEKAHEGFPLRPGEKPLEIGVCPLKLARCMTGNAFALHISRSEIVLEIYPTMPEGLNVALNNIGHSPQPIREVLETFPVGR